MTLRAHRSRPCPGFTLVELTIVVLVIAVAAALAAPMLGGDAGTRLREAARLLMADLAYAQVESIAHADDPRVVVVDPQGRGYHLGTTSSPGTPITNPVGRLPYRLEFGRGRAAALDGVALQPVSVGGDGRLTFGMYGQLDEGADATLRLTSGGRSVLVTVDRETGEARVGQIE